MHIVKFPCICKHDATAHFGRASFTGHGLDLDDSDIKNCGDGHDYFNYDAGCKCGMFQEMNNLQYLEHKDDQHRNQG